MVILSVDELLSQAKDAIESSQTSLRDAAEFIAVAQEQGATQRQIAEAVGKSPAWVNRLLGWRAGGYQDATAFGPQAKASRQRAGRVQSPEHKKLEPATSSEQAQVDAERARAEAAKANADKAKAEAAKAKADARKARAEADKAKAEARARAEESAQEFFRNSFGRRASPHLIDPRTREILVKALGMLGSIHDGERATAAITVEKLRGKLGMTWDELIVSADVTQAKAA